MSQPKLTYVRVQCLATYQVNRSNLDRSKWVVSHPTSYHTRPKISYFTQFLKFSNCDLLWALTSFPCPRFNSRVMSSFKAFGMYVSRPGKDSYHHCSYIVILGALSPGIDLISNSYFDSPLRIDVIWYQSHLPLLFIMGITMIVVKVDARLIFLVLHPKYDIPNEMHGLVVYHLHDADQSYTSRFTRRCLSPYTTQPTR